jgi:hypothetical protein
MRFEDYLDAEEMASVARSAGKDARRERRCRTREERRHRSQRTMQRITVWCFLALFLLGLVAAMTNQAGADTTPEAEAAEGTTEASGRLPGDDVPAEKRCYMETEEVQEDFENEKIEQALYDQGYFREDVPMDAELQAYLRAACDESGVPFELALAVIRKETTYQNLQGDDGASIGYMQVQPRWHRARMERLGVTDLMDPFSNFRVGCDYLAELLGKYDTTSALTAYNSGSPGRSDYANTVMGYWEELKA